MFNIGVECGQILFLGAVLAIVAVLHRLPFRLPQGSWRAMPYAIGSAAAFWTIDRVVSIFQASA